MISETRSPSVSTPSSPIASSSESRQSGPCCLRPTPWLATAADLLGLPGGYFGADYIGQLISWRRSNLTRLQQHLEDLLGRPWHESIGRSLWFSEYILYGAFVDRIVGVDDSGHYHDENDICHCCWFREEAEALSSGQSPLRPDAVAVLLQSNMGLSDSDEQRILQQAAPPELRFAEGF